jgi:hypothetical protein
MAIPLRDDVLEADQAALFAIRDLPNYSAVNPDYSVAALSALEDEFLRTRDARIRATRALAAARSAKIAAARLFHGSMRVAKSAVVAQYGDDAPEVQAIGLKKRSERKRPVRRAAPSLVAK